MLPKFSAETKAGFRYSMKKMFLTQYMDEVMRILKELDIQLHYKIECKYV